METESNLPVRRQQSMKVPDARNSNDSGIYTVVGTLGIRMGLLGIWVAYEPHLEGENRSRSQVHFASLQRPTSAGGAYHLHYVFEGFVLDGTDSTDVDTYFGAARVSVDPDYLDSAVGLYWTNRAWRQGLNTAGRFVLSKLEK